MSEATNNNAVAILDASKEAALIESNALDSLKQAYKQAQADLTRHEDVRKQAEHARQTAAVWMARVAWRTATHEGVRGKQAFNITGAARALDVPISTFRPYALAGEALNKRDRAGLLALPALEDITIVEKSFDATTRAEQKTKRLRAAAKQAQLEAKAKELEALKAKQAQADSKPGAQAPAQAPAQGGAQAPASGAQAPAQGAQAPSNGAQAPSVSEEVLKTAKQLVAQIKQLRANREWAAVAPKVAAVLADVFPVLKSGK